MKCKKCGTNDWYVRGKYKRCRECHRETDRRSHQNRKLGVESVRKQRPARPVSQGLDISSLSLQKRLQQSCTRGHDLAGDNVRLDVDSMGRVHRRCRRCEYLAGRKKYGLATPSQMKELLGGRAWSGLAE